MDTYGTAEDGSIALHHQSPMAGESFIASLQEGTHLMKLCARACVHYNTAHARHIGSPHARGEEQPMGGRYKLSLGVQGKDEPSRPVLRQRDVYRKISGARQGQRPNHRRHHRQTFWEGGEDEPVTGLRRPMRAAETSRTYYERQSQTSLMAPNTARNTTLAYLRTEYASQSGRGCFEDSGTPATKRAPNRTRGPAMLHASGPTTAHYCGPSRETLGRLSWGGDDEPLHSTLFKVASTRAARRKEEQKKQGRNRFTFDRRDGSDGPDGRVGRRAANQTCLTRCQGTSQ